ncbi:acetyl-CoA C-acyltransferase [Corynebacterium poyangense]|uniref:Acetyl-CoA C-acyltransferase n=1 Tax=Corynebacterium poyangense TaxID=2684405 RepID=A0A7H0SR89_9CORY|nr:thiolase family protein [Corynebacterium poyangense]MBZ8176495.1 acetyl-CoA C-acyltransferase [Corynebacterium poyangense]QNQ91064.1 acetyl-CoA C-acyltransferase [Corynebacterium poyangense]
MRNAVIVDVVRTAVGKGRSGGALADVHPVDLLSVVLKALEKRNDLDPHLIEDVITGCVLQNGEQSMNIARRGVLAAGWPESIPATTIDRQCGSGQQAIHFAAQGVMAGAYDVVIAAGVESMSRIPIANSVASPVLAGDKVNKRYPNGLAHQGVSAELVADKWGLTREELDEFSVRSHHLAAQATESGAFDNHIVPVEITLPDGSTKLHTVDETIRGDTSLEKLSTLSPSFKNPADVERFPHLDWKITPGNSSPLTDGASAVLIVEESFAEKMGWTPRARFCAFSVLADDPVLMLTAPIPATQKVLERANLTIDDMDVYEVNEAFAPVPLVWAREVGADLEKLNPNGGAIALGHALGSTGTRLLSTLLQQLEATGGRYGLETICEGLGMANAMIIERI